MGELDLELEHFIAWLCEHEGEAVGYPGMYFRSPLASWLSDLTGCVYGIDGVCYGRASADPRCWRLLPKWAQKFVVWTERYAMRAMTGYEAFSVLAEIEGRSVDRVVLC